MAAAGERVSADEGNPSVMELRHLQREVATALELALVASAPSSVIDSMACAAGLLVALGDLPLDSEPLRVWATQAVMRAERSLSAWRSWEWERKAKA